ncbi:MAG: iron ABC transporter, partial [Pseudomonadota bacterium]|nr:iron ABC transporter [Pseudomonadota bacterium]
VVVVMHDLNLTAMFADQVALIVDGALVVKDSVSKALTAERLADAYGCDLKVNEAPVSGFFTLPQLARVF